MRHDTRFDNSLRVRLSGRQCVYCGETATTLEHFPPASWGPLGVLLPACQECNNFAGAGFATKFEDRARHVKARLRNKYRKQLATPEWSEDELDDIAQSLRGSVRAWDETKRRSQERLAWNAEAYLASIDHNNDFAQAVAAVQPITSSERRNSSPIASTRRKARASE